MTDVQQRAGRDWHTGLAAGAARRRAEAAERSARARRDDDQYVRRGLARRDNVRRLRLADRLPTDLGGRRQPTDTNRRAGIDATRSHLKAAGLWGPASERILAELRRGRGAA